MNKTYLDTKLRKIEGQMSYMEKDYNNFKLHNNKQPVYEILNESAVKTTIQTLYDKGLFDNYDNADEVLKDYLLFEVDERRRPDLEKLNDKIHVKCDCINGSIENGIKEPFIDSFALDKTPRHIQRTKI